jgi:hypothetical protein
MMRCQQLTAWAMAWTTDSYSHNKIPCFHLTLIFITSFQNYTVRTVHTFTHYFSKIHFNIKLLYIRRWSRGSSVSIVSGYGLDDRAIEVHPRQGQRNFSLAPVSRLALGPTRPPVQWVPGVLSPEVKRGRGVTLTTHSHLEPRSRMSRSYTSSPPSASMACSGTTLFFTFYIYVGLPRSFLSSGFSSTKFYVLAIYSACTTRKLCFICCIISLFARDVSVL